MVKNAGVTLIELMVTIAIIMLLLAVGVPLAGGWTNSSSTQHAESMLKQAMGMAKAKALENPLGKTSGDPAATLVVENGLSLCVYAGAASSLTCGASAFWQGKVTATVSLNGATTQCIAFSNAGTVISSAVGATNCGTALSYIASKGGQNVSGTLN